jgi:hypothetical protein
MFTRSLLGLLALVVVAVPARAQQAEAPSVYTFVAEWDIARPQWGTFAADFDKVSVPVLEKLSAAGTLVGWGGFESIVHTEDGYSHGVWWQATSYANLEKARLELLKASAGMASLQTATRHRDRLLRTIAANAKSGTGSGYLTVSNIVVKPGKGREWKELWDKYSKPVVDELVAKGTIVVSAIHVEDIHTNTPYARAVATLLPSAEADDQTGAAYDAATAKLSPQERTERQLRLDAVQEPSEHRDLYARVLRYWVK